LRRFAIALALLPMLLFGMSILDSESGFPFSKHVREQRMAAFKEMLKTQYDSNRKAEYAAASRQFDKYQSRSSILHRVVEPSMLMILPYLIFSSCLLVSLYRNRAGRLTPWANGLVGACFVCLAIFLYYVVHPFRCIDIGCLVAVLFVVGLALLGGSTMMVTVALVLKKVRASAQE
jgi:hypothetical protein